MKINLWAKKGKVVVSLVANSNPNTAPTLTVEMQSPQVLYDEETGAIKIIETK